MAVRVVWTLPFIITAFFATVMLYVALGGELFAIVVLVPGVAGASVSLSMFPRRFELWPDRLQIVFIASKWDVPLASITDIRKPTARERLFFFGARLDSLFARASFIETRAPKRGLWSLLYSAPDVMISAHNHEAFITALESAWQASKARQRDGQ